jgi:phospholipid/cholesterol/gamma-HCH transport system substrate-binding protein
MKISKLFFLGSIMFIAIIAFIFGILYLQDIKIQSSNFTFSVIFDSAQGLNEGNNVTMLGKRIGRVTKTRIIEGNKIGVELSIDNSFAFKIPIDSKINVKSEGILGAKYISIEPGKDTQHSLLAGDVVEGIREVDFSEITPGIIPLTQDLGAFARRLKATLGEKEKENIQNTILNVEILTKEMVGFIKEYRNVLSDEERENIKQFTENLKVSTESFKSATTDLELTLKKDLKKVGEAISGLKKFTDKADDFNHSITSLKESSELIKTASENINTSSKQFSEIINKLNGNEGTLPRLLNDDVIYNHIDSLVLSVQAIVTDFNDNPAKYIKAYIKAKK